MRMPLLAILLGGATASDQADLAKALAGRTAGRPVACLTTTRSLTPQAFGNRVLLYNDGARVWRNDLPAACPGLDDDAIVVSDIYGGQQCRNDHFYTLQRGGIGIPGPHCRLGDFTPWDKPPR